MPFRSFDPAVKKKISSIGKMTLGGLLIAVGIAGLFLPFLQGLLLIFLGGSLLSSESKWVRRKINALAKRFPRQTARFTSIKSKLASRWKKAGMTRDFRDVAILIPLFLSLHLS